jgi:hypothetical protein
LVFTRKKRENNKIHICGLVPTKVIKNTKLQLLNSSRKRTRIMKTLLFYGVVKNSFLAGPGGTHLYIVPALVWLKQEDCNFEANLGKTMKD